MEKKILAALYFLLVSYVSGAPVDDFVRAISVPNCGKTIFSGMSPDRIVGGKDATPGANPWMVGLLEDHGWGHTYACGATIIGTSWVATAAHCLDYPNSPKSYKVRVGQHKLSDPYASTVQTIDVIKIAMHKGYNANTNENDIALLKTATPIDFKGSRGYVNAACLPTSDADPTGYVVTSGWGHTVKGGRNSDILQEVTVPMVSRRECNVAYGGTITDTMICAGSDYKDSCQNDSGGPLIKMDSNGVGTLVGIVSHGIGCGQPGYAGVYTKCSSYLDWMAKEMSQ